MARHYLFADESGNTDFARKRGATRYFAVGTVHIAGDAAVEAIRSDLLRLRTDLAWAGRGIIDGFHASEDAQAVRDEVFAVLRAHPLTVDVTVFEKSKIRPTERHDPAALFAFAWREHLARLAVDLFAGDGGLLVVLATVGTHALRAAIRRSLESMTRECAWPRQPRIAFASAASDPALQVADYATWAVTRARNARTRARSRSSATLCDRTSTRSRAGGCTTTETSAR